MTTSNIIHTGTFQDTLFIPAETVFHNDSLQYVFLEKDGSIVKQIVDLGDQNENFILIRKGLTENDRVLLSIPDNHEDLAFQGFDIYYEIEERKLQEEKEAPETLTNHPPRPAGADASTTMN